MCVKVIASQRWDVFLRHGVVIAVAKLFRFTLIIVLLNLFGRPFVKQFTLCYQTIVCLSVLSVTLVYCGQTVGWIKMKLGMQ